MQDEQYIIDTLGISDWDEAKKEPVLTEATQRIGKTLLGELDDAQRNEYNAIIDDDHAVIDAWLDQNVPDFKDNPVYKAIEEGYEADPEKNNPAKLFATIAWIQLTIPNVQELINQTLANYKQELSV